MNRPVLAFNEFEPATPLLDKKKATVISLRPDAVQSIAAFSSALSLAHFRSDSDHRDSKLVDYLLLGVLSLFVHSAVVDHFKQPSFEQEAVIEPVKPSKVQISFVRPPPPKPMVQPPPPPPPKVVALKKPPKPKVQPKPAPKFVETKPVPSPAPVIQADAPVIPAPPAPPPPPVVEEKVTQPSAGAGYLNNPPPVYPEIAMDRGWEGKVLMKVHVLPSGKPDTVSILKSSGKDVLDDEAVKTVKKWSFVPAKRGTTPIAGWVTVPISFNLQG